MMKRPPRIHTLDDAMRSNRIRAALHQFIGLPFGGFHETEQARRQLKETVERLAPRRNYQLGELMEHALVPLLGVYQWRPPPSTTDD